MKVWHVAPVGPWLVDKTSLDIEKSVSYATHRTPVYARAPT